MAERSSFRFPHAMASVIQMLRLQLGMDVQRNVSEAVSLMDDRDRWVEDNLSSLNDRIGVVAGLPTGALVDWAGLVVPDGFLACDGSAVNRADYPDLFTALGTTWGAGNGSTTFNLPDFRGRTAIGSGTGSGLTNRVVGQRGGEENHVLTVAEMPSHSHPYFQGGYAGAYANGGTWGDTGNIAGTTTATGGGGAHNNMQPYAVVLKIIKT